MRNSTANVPLITVQAIRFQRTVVGATLLAFYITQWFAPVYAACVVLLSAVALPFGYDPLSLLYITFVRLRSPLRWPPSLTRVDRASERFGTILYAGTIMIGVAAYHVVSPAVTRCLFLALGIVALVAGSTGFCLFGAVCAAVRPAEFAPRRPPRSP
jgi:hypothetical protein